MLVLRRERDQVIRIGEEIKVRVMEIRGNSVRLGITAPKDVEVHRQEVYEAMRAEASLQAGLHAGQASLLAGRASPLAGAKREA